MRMISKDTAGKSTPQRRNQDGVLTTHSSQNTWSLTSLNRENAAKEEKGEGEEKKEEGWYDWVDRFLVIFCQECF